MAKKADHTEEQFATVEEALGKTEQFIENNRKMISYVIIGIIGVVLIIMGYFRFISGPNEMKAFNAIHSAEQYFEADSFQLALDGDGVNPGFLEIIDDFGRTKSGNLANYYAGICYMHIAMNDTTATRNDNFETAIDYLKDFSSDDDLIQPMAYGAIGDAYDELDQQEEAVKYYKKAVDASSNDFSTPKFLMKVGIMYSAMGNHEEALAAFEKIKSDYYTTNEGRDIKKYIAKEKTLLGK